MDWLLDTSIFNTRNTCGPGWTPQLIALYQLANMLIALAYFAIPLSLGVLAMKLRTLHKIVKFNSWILWLFIIFITACGITHLGHVAVFWFPAYRLYTTLDMVTAIVSLITAIILPVFLYDTLRRLPIDEQSQQNDI